MKNQKSLKNITRGKVKILLEAIQNPLLKSTDACKEKPFQSTQKVLLKNQSMTKNSILNLNYPLKAKILSFNEEINTFDSNSVVGIFNSYVVKKSNFREYNLNCKTLLAKLVLNFSKSI